MKSHCVTCFSHTEWKQPNSSQAGRVLHEGCHFAAEAAGEADVPHQLHGDGQSDWGASYLPSLQGTADQSCITAPKKGG